MATPVPGERVRKEELRAAREVNLARLSKRSGHRVHWWPCQSSTKEKT
jgi:hypothetical protein